MVSVYIMEIEQNVLKEIVEGVTGGVAYIKLFKMTKNYNWEIKLLSLNIDELEKLNQQMQERFGEQI